MAAPAAGYKPDGATTEPSRRAEISRWHTNKCWGWTAAEPAGGATAGTGASTGPVTHLFADWGGVRTKLDDADIYLSLDHTAESAWNAVGGIRQGADYAHQIAFEKITGWEKLAGIAGPQTHIILINCAGCDASADYVGDTVAQAQDIYGGAFAQALNLVVFYTEESLSSDRINVALVRFAPGNELVALPLYCNFMVLTTCGHLRVLTSNQCFEVWPRSEWGGRIRVRPTAEICLMTGVFQSQPFPTSSERYTQGDYSILDWTLRGMAGVSVPLEFAYEPVLSVTQLTGHYKIGLDWDTSRYPDNLHDSAGRPFVVSNLSPASQCGRLQLWARFDQVLLHTGRHQDNGVILFVAYGHDDPRTSIFRDFLSLGLMYNGFWPARPNDQIDFNCTYYDVSHRLTQTERLQTGPDLPFSNSARDIQRNAQILEVNYDLPIYPGIQLQPEIEYLVHPDATTAVRNALVVGLKTHVSF